jgi:hypothetical protein
LRLRRPIRLAAPPIPKHFAKILAKVDGASAKTAHKDSSVREAYQVMAPLHLKPEQHALVI